MNVLGKITTFINESNIVNESGFRNMRTLAKKWKKAKIYYHQDLDGVASALAIKEYLKQYGIKTTSVEMIQYGDLEYNVKKPKKDEMPVLVDFGHNKIRMVIYTDHHDHSDKERKTNIKNQSRILPKTPSNAQAISQTISPRDIFPPKDITIISTVDSADFARYGLTPDDIANAVFHLDKSIDITKNHQMMGLVVNKLLLTYKNKPNFLNKLVLTAKPSLLSMYNTIIKLAKEYGYKKPEDIQQGSKNYKEQRVREKIPEGRPNDIPRMKNGESFIYGTTIFQKGGGYMGGNNTYDRYTIFSIYPDADYLCTQWPMGMIQLSAQPFSSKKNPIHLGDLVMKKILPQFKSKLQNEMVSLDYLKYVSERKDIKEHIKGAMGFTWDDLMLLYKDKIKGIESKNDWWPNIIKDITNKPYKFLSKKQKDLLKKITIPAWDIVLASSGGHANITNISGLSFVKDTKGIMNDICINIMNEMKDKRLR